MLPQAGGQSREQSPAGIIWTLTHHPDLERTLGCGILSSYREEAKALVHHGAGAIPELKKVLHSLEQRFDKSPFSYNAGWLLLSYAKIEGPPAFIQLRRIFDRGKQSAPVDVGSSLHWELDDAIALSLGLTAYVSGTRESGEVVCRGGKPGDALEQLILAWQRGDRRAFESQLGPDAIKPLALLLRTHKKSWAALNAEMWHGNRGRNTSVGFRFDIQGSWADPPETLSPPGGDVDAADNPVINTQFTNKFGGNCGRQAIKFRLTSAGNALERNSLWPQRYQVDVSAIVECAVLR